MPARAALADACLLGGDTVLDWHRALVASGRFSPDERQNEAALLLQKFADEIVAEAKTTRARANGGGGFFARVRDFVGGNQAATDKRAGLYLHGGVGRGKTVLMDGFFLQLPIVRKRRAHFHAFMRHFHEDITTGRGEDPLSQVADRIADQNDILCFDEFHVSDIADAMILARLLDRLLARGVRFVMTSNYAPQDLYPNGLARDRFLPAINLLRERFSVFGFAGGDDYRSRQLDAGGRYFFPTTTARKNDSRRRGSESLAAFRSRRGCACWGAICPPSRGLRTRCGSLSPIFAAATARKPIICAWPKDSGLCFWRACRASPTTAHRTRRGASLG